MENIIKNIKDGEHWGDDRSKSWFDLARYFADEHEKKTGNKCCVRRVLDYVDTFNDRDREHYSFDVIEIVLIEA